MYNARRSVYGVYMAATHHTTATHAASVARGNTMGNTTTSAPQYAVDYAAYEAGRGRHHTSAAVLFAATVRGQQYTSAADFMRALAADHKRPEWATKKYGRDVRGITRDAGDGVGRGHTYHGTYGARLLAAAKVLQAQRVQAGRTAKAPAPAADAAPVDAAPADAGSAPAAA